MCGILAILIGGELGRPEWSSGALAARVGLSRGRIEAARDRMRHRGPDGEGYLEVWCAPESAGGGGGGGGGAILAHRRLAVVDLSDAGAQPMVGRGRAGWRSEGVNGMGGGGAMGGAGVHWASAIAYNGELYNDASVRGQLRARWPGNAFASACDTETVLAALDAWGVDGLDAFRGMFALVHVDRERGRAILARDPMGVKPLYWCRVVGHVGGVERAVVVVASEIDALLAAAGGFGVSPEPDFAVVSAYATTIRTTMGERTLFEGVRIVEPGAWIEFDLADAMLRESRGWHGWFRPGETGRSAGAFTLAESREVEVERCCAVLADSVEVHLRSDAALCALLSGGIDSTVLAALVTARGAGGVMSPQGGAGSALASALHTFCAGASREEGGGGGGGVGGVAAEDDFVFAARVAGVLGTSHHEARVDRARFRGQWREMIEASGLPLSTPNEVAILEVARAIRGSGHVVALSGEGADELLGGYDLVLRQALAWEARAREGGSEGERGVARATALASAAAWVPLEVKRGILREGVWERAGCDEALVRAYADEWSRWCEPFARADAAEGPLRAHLRFLQRVNLHGLLVRLDQSTMRASVEGRTPFADVAVARWASMLPSSMTLSGVGEREGDGADAMPVESTKRVLREALWPILRRAVKPGHGDGEELTRGVGRRAKASFPLPFQEWVRDQHEVLLRSPLAGEFFSPAAIGVVAADPAKAWNIAWPMMNITMWAQRWWGADSMASAAARGGGLGLGLGLGLGGGALRG